MYVKMTALKQTQNYHLLSIMVVLLSPLYFLALLALEIIDSVWFQIKKNEK
jgi:hypothetical protein